MTDPYTRLADVIRAEEEMKLNMLSFSDSGGCGTTACIGGFAGALLGQPVHQWDERSIMKFLGVSEKIANQLAYPDRVGREGWSPWGATAEQAARVVEILRDTGEVRWDLVAPGAEETE